MVSQYDLLIIVDNEPILRSKIVSVGVSQLVEQ